jgi:predicted dehydrogenase
MIAVLGLGSIGLRHAGNALALGCKVVGFDPDPARRQLLADKGAQVVDCRDAALAQAKACIIATPSDRHEDDLEAAINTRRHALVEKPIGHGSARLADLLGRAKTSGVVVAAALNLRLHPAVRAAKKALSSGAIGQPLWGRFMAALYLPDWRPGQDWRQGYANDPRTGGALFDYIHEFDLAAHLLGPCAPLACVASHTGSIGLAAEDMGDAILRHDNGATTTIHVDYVTRPRLRGFEINGTKGRIQVDLDGRSFVRLGLDGAEIENQTFAGSYADDYVAELAAFLDAVAGAPPVCSGDEAFAVLSCVLAARSLAGLPS